jgi:transglutaminase-like putative cysteine protease
MATESARFDVVHRTAIVYDGEVLGSYNTARLTPEDSERQVVLEHRIDTSPRVDLTEYRDYWGTRVHHFDLHDRHHRLDVVARTRVETTSPAPTTEPVTWAVLRAESVRDRWCEFLLPTPLTTPDDRILAGAAVIEVARTPLEAVELADRWVTDRLDYERGVTHVDSSAAEVLDHGRGVCQDFAHVLIAVLRVARIPARYVSGYLHPESEPRIGVPVAGESHAWVEAWVGSWYGIDATNRTPVDARYISVARGRDYRDVAPLAGVYHGAPTRDLDVRVEITRIA